MKRLLNFSIALGFMLLILSSCTKDQAENKSMGQIYEQKGVPVRTKLLKHQLFEASRIYQATLSGLDESSAYASFGGRIEKIFVKVGDYVRKDQVVMTFPKDLPAAKYYQAKTAYENAKKSLQRVKNLYAKKGISRQNMDNVQAQFDVARANWETVSKIVEVKAPINGYVTRIDVSETDNVKKKSELLTVSQTNKLKAKIWVNDTEIGDFKTGLPAKALWQGRKISGHVSQVAMSMNVMHQAFGVVVVFNNPNGHFYSGVTANIEITVYKNPKALVLARSTLLKEDGKYFVYLLENGKTKKQAVVPGRQYGLKTEITKGLNPGDVIITSGQMLLKPGSKVKVINS